MTSNFRTPITCVDGRFCGNRLFIKREDLLPVSFGGNKYRIALKIFDDIKKRNCDSVVGYGSSKSNFCRTIANLAFMRGIKCYIVSSGNDRETKEHTFNSQMVRDFKAEIIYCNKNNVAQTIKNTLDRIKEQGGNPYYVNGNEYGEGNERVLSSAYIDVFREILIQEKNINTHFDYLFLPLGTGMTMSGLIIGKEQRESNLQIIGLSIARDKKRCHRSLEKYLKANGSNTKEYIVNDDYLCGGYGVFDENIEQIIENSLGQYGIPLDPTYTAKAFFGMKEYLKHNNISNKNILFLHTGGTPLFFDYYKKEGK